MCRGLVHSQRINFNRIELLIICVINFDSKQAQVISRHCYEQYVI